MKKRRLISVILCMIMILQLTPMVFAEDVEERNPEDYLISKWDFEGSDLETQLADKAEKGSTSDPVELVGEGIVIENGVMKIPTTAKTYARVKCPEGSDQYSMANKTVILRAKISEVTEGSTLVAGIFGKAGLWNVYFANAKIGRALSLHYVKFDKDTGETSSQTICPTSLDQENCFPTTTDVYLTYAATTVFDEENGTAVTTFYRSNVENPTSAEDFVVLSSGTYTVDASAKLSSENDLIIGKRFGDISKDRMLNSAFTDIMIYDTILTEQEIVRVSSGLKEAETSDTSEEPDLSTALDRHLVSHYDFEGETLDERIAQYDPNFYEGNTNTISVCKFCGTDVHHYVADPFAKLGKSAEEYFTTVLHTDATAWKTDLEITFDEEGPGKNDGDNGNNNNNNNGSKPSGSDKTPADTGESQKPSASKTTDTEAQTSEGEKKGCKSSFETGGVILLCVLGTSATVATGTRRGKTRRCRK